MYLQRYMAHFPAAGEVVIFDRSWYNRAGVERVMGFCTPEETQRFLDMAPMVEKAMVDSGIILIKYWLEVSADEQTRRLESRIDDPRKIWKLSPMDLKSYRRWYDYSRARDAMFDATDTAWAPWYVADNDDKKRGRLNIISHLLSQVPYEPYPGLDVREDAQAPEGRRLHRTGTVRAGTSRHRSEQRPGDEEEVMTDDPGAAAGVAAAEADATWYALAPAEVAARAEVDPASGLSAAEAQQRLQEYGPNALAAAKHGAGAGSGSSSSTRTTCRSCSWSPPWSAC